MSAFVDLNKQAEFQRQEWSQKWPNHCPKCEGVGGTIYQDDPSPAGVSLSSGWMEFYDPCPNCIEKGCCPRCGEQAWLASVWVYYDESTGVTCPFCLWNDVSTYLRRSPALRRGHKGVHECYCLETS